MSGSSILHCTAILFDLDGVLVDSAACVEETWRQWSRRHGLDPARIVEIAHGRRSIETVALVAPHLDVSDEVATLVAIESTTTEGVFEVPGARALVQDLPRDAWAVVTSGVRSVASLRIRHVGLPWPPVLVCADEITRGKPDPEGYLVAAEHLGRRPEECVVIEDAPPGLEAARAAGMRSIAISTTYPANALGAANVIARRLGSLGIARDRDGLAISVVAA